MTEYRKVTDRLSVSAQISAEEAAAAVGDGFALVINNRPDGEAPGQPAGAAIEAAARAAGADYLHLPVTGRPSPETARAQAQAVAHARGPVLAFCRSGTRSITAWAMGEAAAGVDRNELVRLAAAAGYDLAPVLGVQP
ncbi:MAG TPA: TIGR01244 family sulfur transferase [Caulobacteraceae bacterium]|nr:TIGR01244 family sulfur transferase [Caulobacteraceae bacterium]